MQGFDARASGSSLGLDFDFDAADCGLLPGVDEDDDNAASPSAAAAATCSPAFAGEATALATLAPAVAAETGAVLLPSGRGATTLALDFGRDLAGAGAGAGAAVLEAGAAEAWCTAGASDCARESVVVAAAAAAGTDAPFLTAADLDAIVELAIDLSDFVGPAR